MAQGTKDRKSAAVRALWRHRGALAVLLLILLAVLLGLAWSRQRELRQQLEWQGKLIETLQEGKAEEEEGMIHEGAPVITREQVREQVNSLEELVTREYLYTNADQYENQSQVTIRDWDINLPLTTKRFLLAYDGRIKAGVDLSRAEIQVDETARTVTVTLPESEILSHEIFEDQIRVFDEKDSIFNKITIDNYNEFVAEQKKVMEQRAVDMGLLTEAGKAARTELRAWLSLLPGMDTYRLELR